MSKILFADQDGVQVLNFVGDVRVCLGPTISTYLASIDKRRGVRAIVIDLRPRSIVGVAVCGIRLSHTPISLSLIELLIRLYIAY